MSVAKRRLNACPGASQSGFPGRLTRFMRSLWMPKSRAGSPILLIVPDTVENANTCKRSQVVPNRRSQQHTKPQGNRMLTIFVSLRQARWHTIYRKGRFTLWNRTWLESNLVVFRFAAMLHLEPLFSISSSCFARCGSQNSSFRQGVAESQ